MAPTQDTSQIRFLRLYRAMKHIHLYNINIKTLLYRYFFPCNNFTLQLFNPARPSSGPAHPWWSLGGSGASKGGLTLEENFTMQLFLPSIILCDGALIRA